MLLGKEILFLSCAVAVFSNWSPCVGANRKENKTTSNSWLKFCWVLFWSTVWENWHPGLGAKLLKMIPCSAAQKIVQFPPPLVCFLSLHVWFPKLKYWLEKIEKWCNLLFNSYSNVWPRYQQTQTLCERFKWLVLEPLSLLYTFVNYKCSIKISSDSDSFLEWLKGLLCRTCQCV